MIYNINIHISENLTNDHETTERAKPSTSIPRYQNKSGKYDYIIIYKNKQHSFTIILIYFQH